MFDGAQVAAERGAFAAGLGSFARLSKCPNSLPFTHQPTYFQTLANSLYTDFFIQVAFDQACIKNAQ